MWARLQQFVAHPAVQGKILDLGDNTAYPALVALYERWYHEPGGANGVTHANWVAVAIKELLISQRSAYPNLENILIVGGDDIVPFRRIPDEVTFANEGDFPSPSAAETPLAASLQGHYFLTDNAYASFASLPWRGRELYLPDYALGRLVETPAEISAALDAFRQQPVLRMHTGSAIGQGDFKDATQAQLTQLQAAGLQVNASPTQRLDLKTMYRQFIDQPFDLRTLNIHATYNQWDLDSQSKLAVTANDLQTSAAFSHALIFSIVCHAGLSVADDDPQAETLDFAQVLVGKGALYVANTGYGYGDADTIGYSERLMQLFTQALAQGGNAGQALQKAKLNYFNELSARTMTAYDEKVLSVVTFYGVPLVQLQWPQARPTTAKAQPDHFWQLAPPTACTPGAALLCRPVTFTPTYTTQTDPTDKGVYYTVANEPPQVRAGAPLQPSASITITELHFPASGALFEGGDYETFSAFNPIIAQVITDTGRAGAPEPVYNNPEWRPSTWELINNVNTLQGQQQRFVVIPAQYQSTSPTHGVERRFTQMHYTLYYSATKDTIPPTILVQNSVSPAQSKRNLTVEAQDPSRVIRVVVAYTTGDGAWQHIDLQQVAQCMSLNAGK